MKIRSHAVSMRLMWLLITAACSLALLVPAQAASFSAADEKNVREVVQGQLDALARDDADKAFSYATPNIRQAMGTASGFLAMVRDGYPVVYRPASVAFLKPEGQADQVIQRVHMLDAQGESWLAIYSLQRQPSNAWRITGCVVVKNKGRMV